MMLRATGIGVRFGAVRAVDGVDLHVDPGEVLGIIGPNGSGKSTFLNAITGLVPAKGTASIDGTSYRLGRPGAAAKLGLRRTFQTPQVHDGLTCLENVLVGSTDQRRRSVGAAWALRAGMWKRERERWAKAMDALAFTGIAHLAGTAAGSLPYGQRRLLEIARASVADPKIVLLDEPAAGLNQVETEQLQQLIKAMITETNSIIVVEHKMDFLQGLCSRMVVLELGRVIAQGPPAQVLRDQKVIDAYLGTVAEHA
jgi:ABC-type branched-subunit amino acid transport system ATPase component